MINHGRGEITSNLPGRQTAVCRRLTGSMELQIPDKLKIVERGRSIEIVLDCRYAVPESDRIWHAKERTTSCARHWFDGWCYFSRSVQRDNRCGGGSSRPYDTSSRR